jgi:hypothetical protein
VILDVGCIDQADNMKIVRVGLHSLVLVIADIAGIAGGALAAFRISGVPNQVGLQLPIAVMLSICFFSVWILSLRALGPRRLQPVIPKELRVCFAVSFLWAPLVFVPLHYCTQGYLTSIGNLVALALYQLPVNALALFGASILQKSRSDGSTQQSAAPNGGPAMPPGNSGVTEGPPSVS